MRIISQSRKIDIKYSDIVVYVVGGEIRANGLDCSNDMQWYTLGEYKSDERAIDVMTEIRQTYYKNKVVELHANAGKSTEVQYSSYFIMPFE